jgi:hypothetical protein
MSGLYTFPKVTVTVLIVLIGLLRIVRIMGVGGSSSAARIALFVLVAVPLCVLTVARVAAVWRMSPAMYGNPMSVSGGSPSASSSASPAVYRPARPRTVGSDGWIGRYDDGRGGVAMTVTIPAANSPRQRDTAALFAAADGATKKVGLVGVVALVNSTPNPVLLDTSVVVLHAIDGVQTFGKNPADVIGAAAAEHQKELADFRPPYRIPSGGRLNLGVIFLPGDTDLSALDHVRVTLDGKWIDVR